MSEGVRAIVLQSLLFLVVVGGLALWLGAGGHGIFVPFYSIPALVVLLPPTLAAARRGSVSRWLIVSLAVADVAMVLALAGELLLSDHGTDLWRGDLRLVWGGAVVVWLAAWFVWQLPAFQLLRRQRPSN